MLGRKPISAKPHAKVEALEAIKRGEMPSTHYMKHRIAALGLASFKDVPTGGRGRPAKILELTARGENYLRLSRTWFQKMEA